MKVKQVLAIISIILLLGLYALTFIFALMDSPQSGQMFQSALYATIAIPILLWISIQCLKVMKEKKDQQDDGTS